MKILEKYFLSEKTKEIFESSGFILKEKPYSQYDLSGLTIKRALETLGINEELV